MIIPQSPPSPSGPRRFRSRTWLAALLSLLVLLLWSRFAEPATPGTVTVEQIPRPPAGSWTVDLTGTLPAAERAEIDRIARAVREQGRGELAVVVIGSTGGTPHRDFATLLANVWGVGSAERDDGVLILAALDDRAIEIVLGLGLDSPAEIQISQEIVDREMIPRFRAGDPAGGIRAGAEAVARRLFKAALPADLGVKAIDGSAAAEAVPVPAAPAAPAAPDSAAPPGLLSAVEALPPAASSSSSFADLPLPLVIGLPVLLVFGAVAVAIGLPRRCPRCQTRMRRLREAEDDAHLNADEKLEEELESVDHRVWICPGCNEIARSSWPRLFSSYGKCPHCDVRAFARRETVEQVATYDQGGTVRIEGSCRHCDHRTSTTRATPRLHRPDDDADRRSSLPAAAWAASSSSSPSSSASSASSTSSSSPAGSSSSSSGSGFSGGSSGGAGGGGKW